MLLGFGNYAGDVLHFGEAAEQLRAKGHDIRIVAVTDDIASAPADKAAERRGIAGDLTVFKVAGAAAEEGLDLDEVERLARHANDRTRTLGFAFAGCTLPGADAPLFEVPEGKMSLGLGIHGEPGLSDAPPGTADEVARELVDGVLADAPQDAGTRIAVLLNGLGSCKYEELFVTYRAISRLLGERGLTIVEPEVGEQCTSLDMAGISLTLMWLDDDRERRFGSIMNFGGYFGGAIAPWITGVIADSTGSYSPSFYLAGVIAAAGAAFYWFLVRRPISHDELAIAEVKHIVETHPGADS